MTTTRKQMTGDGTCLAFNPPQYVREIAGWLNAINRQPQLALDWEHAA